MKKEDILKFNIGDAVTVNSSDSEYEGIHIIKEVIEIDDGLSKKYMYTIFPINNEGKTYTYKKSVLEFQYHDSNWEKYLSESVKNGLPAWRGELYNFMTLDEREWRTYKEDTLPPERMEHILNEHSFYRRVKILMKIPKMKNEIVKRMNCSEDEVEEIMESLRTKIGYYNGLYTRDVLPHRKGHDNTKFDIDENKLIRVVDYCDKYMHVNDKGEITKSKDHFPPYMTDYAIMKAIKEAYETVSKIGNRKIEEKRFKRYRWEKEVDTVKSHVLYEGMSKDGLIIRFWYNFDLDLIETVYPIISITER